jgi:hypothetical protein
MGQRDHRALAVDRDLAAVVGQLANVDGAAAGAERLPGRIDPERAQREEQPALAPLAGGIADPVAQPRATSSLPDFGSELLL